MPRGVWRCWSSRGHIALGPRPKRTIVFAFFGSEEAGGFGSRYFADRPVVPLTQIVANLQFEMIGRPDDKVPAHTLWLTGFERSTLGPALAKQGAKLVQDPHPEQSFFTRSDNIQFARRGVIAHTVSSFGLHKEYHQPSDEIARIDFAAHDRRDPLDARADPVAGELGVQAGVVAGDEAVAPGPAFAVQEPFTAESAERAENKKLALRSLRARR